jgi:hypothetical protein
MYKQNKKDRESSRPRATTGIPRAVDGSLDMSSDAILARVELRTDYAMRAQRPPYLLSYPANGAVRIEGLADGTLGGDDRWVLNSITSQLPAISH